MQASVNEGVPLLLVGAYRWGRASDLAPLGYLSLVWSFLIGAIISQQGIFHFRKFGADSYVVDMVGILVLPFLPETKELPVEEIVRVFEKQQEQSVLHKVA